MLRCEKSNRFDVFLAITAIPEPGTVGLLTLEDWWHRAERSGYGLDGEPIAAPTALVTAIIVALDARHF